MSFFDKMKDAGEDIKDAFAEGAHDLAEKAGERSLTANLRQLMTKGSHLTP